LQQQGNPGHVVSPPVQFLMHGKHFGKEGVTSDQRFVHCLDEIIAAGKRLCQSTQQRGDRVHPVHGACCNRCRGEGEGYLAGPPRAVKEAQVQLQGFGHDIVDNGAGDYVRHGINTRSDIQ
jgi:hypothetical protein